MSSPAARADLLDPCSLVPSGPSTSPSARLACVNVLKLNRLAIDRSHDEQGQNKHVDRLVALQHWARPFRLEEGRLTVHVLEAIDPAAAILEFAAVNLVV